jgi:hypothetical protein
MSQKGSLTEILNGLEEIRKDLKYECRVNTEMFTEYKAIQDEIMIDEIIKLHRRDAETNGRMKMLSEVCDLILEKTRDNKGKKY